MTYISASMGDHLSALLVSLMAFWLALVERNPFRPCSWYYPQERVWTFLAQLVISETVITKFYINFKLPVYSSSLEFARWRLSVLKVLIFLHYILPM